MRQDSRAKLVVVECVYLMREATFYVFHKQNRTKYSKIDLLDAVSALCFFIPMTFAFPKGHIIPPNYEECYL